MAALRPLHLIGNAHLDPVWLWEWSDGLDAVRATFRAQLDLLREHPGYVFTCSSSCYYEWVEQVDPALFAEIRTAVRAGRIALAGGWYIQTEGNTGNGEAFARLGLYGQKYFAAAFGSKCRSGYLPDTFGHHGNFPALLRGAEMDFHVFQRPPDWGVKLPQALFRWIGANCESVVAYRITGYAFGGFVRAGKPDAEALRAHMDRSLAKVTEAMPAAMLFYGVGDHGGGPTRDALALLESDGPRCAAERGFMPVASSPDAFFASLDPSAPLPEHRGAIQNLSIGCYSGLNRLKRAIRHAEYALLESEALTAAAALLRAPAAPARAPLGSSAAQHERLWKRVLFALDHDIATGCSIKAASDQAARSMAAVTEECDEMSTLAAAELARRIETRNVGPVQPLVLVRPWPEAMELPVEVELMGLPDRFAVVDPSGRAVLHQELPPRALAFNQDHGRRRFIFVPRGQADNLAAYAIAPIEEQVASEPAPSPADDSIQSVRLDWSAGVGVKGAACDGRPFLRPGAPIALNLLDDDSDSWGHSRRGMTRLILSYDLFAGALAHVRSERTEDGPVRSTVRSLYEGERARVELRTSTVAGFAGLCIEARVDWRERFKMLKLSFDSGLAGPLTARAKIPYCREEESTDGREIPAQEWIHLEGGGGGLALVTDTTYSYSVRGAILDATLLRSVPYAWDHNTPIENRDEVEVTDQGEHLFRCLLVPGLFSAPRLEALARCLLLPPRIVREYPHDGLAGSARTERWIAGDNADIGFGALKRTEAGDGWALRLVELGGRHSSGTVTLGQRSASVSLEPLAIATVVFRDDGRIERTSFLEGL